MGMLTFLENNEAKKQKAKEEEKVVEKPKRETKSK